MVKLQLNHQLNQKKINYLARSIQLQGSERCSSCTLLEWLSSGSPWRSSPHAPHKLSRISFTEARQKKILGLVGASFSGSKKNCSEASASVWCFICSAHPSNSTEWATTHPLADLMTYPVPRFFANNGIANSRSGKVLVRSGIQDTVPWQLPSAVYPWVINMQKHAK